MDIAVIGIGDSSILAGKQRSLQPQKPTSTTNRKLKYITQDLVLQVLAQVTQQEPDLDAQPLGAVGLRKKATSANEEPPIVMVDVGNIDKPTSLFQVFSLPLYFTNTYWHEAFVNWSCFSFGGVWGRYTACKCNSRIQG